MERGQRTDDYWKIKWELTEKFKNIETTQEYDVRVTTFDEGDVKSMNRLKQEISLWVGFWT